MEAEILDGSIDFDESGDVRWKQISNKKQRL